MPDFLTSIWFRIGLFVILLVLVGIKFWLSRRKYLQEQREAQAILEQQNSAASRDSFLLMESDLRDRDLRRLHANYRRTIANPPPPEFDDAIKNYTKVERNNAGEVVTDHDDEPPPSYSDYIKTISSTDPQTAEAISTILREDGKQFAGGRKCGAVVTNPPDVEIYL